jgi:hypothetical protein
MNERIGGLKLMPITEDDHSTNQCSGQLSYQPFLMQYAASIYG